uniref:Eukaryotic translation initiation factor 4B n=1 Tax=Solanum tuberosum TaxID=4113 RepID=M1DY38_SOLTU
MTLSRRRGSSDDSHRQGGFRRDTDREIAPSRADETDDWGAAKKTSAANKAFVPSSGRRFDRRESFELNGSDSDSDRWTKRKKEEGGRRFASGGGAFDSFNRKKRWVIGFMGRVVGLWVKRMVKRVVG